MLSYLVSLFATPVNTQRDWRCRSHSAFFGLTSDYQEAMYEEFFMLKQHGNWSFQEAYMLPTGLRRWFLNRLVEHFEEKNKAQEEATR